MIRSSLIALLLCSVPLAQADTKKTTASDKADAAEKAAAEKAAPAKPKSVAKPVAEPEVKPSAKPKPAAKPVAEPVAEPEVKPAVKPAAKPVKPVAEPAVKPEVTPAAKPIKPVAKPGAVDAADQALLNHAANELKKLSSAQTASLLKVCNEGAPADLQTIPGIGEVKAAAIIKARPHKSADQLIMVDGVGVVTFDGVVKWVKDGMTKDAPADKKPAVKPEAKPATPAKTEAAKPETVEKKLRAAVKTTAEKVAPVPAPK